MISDVLVVGPIQANCYVLGCPETKEALVVDPGGDPDIVASTLADHGLKPVIYFHTHGHLDHVGATSVLKERLGGEILLHQADQVLYERAPESALGFGIELPPVAPVDRFIEESIPVTWGRYEGSAIHTPGHSPGGVCLRIGARVYSGDTLFRGSIGRTDLPGGSYEELMTSIRVKLLTLPDETLVLPGHGPATTIGQEKKTNPFLQGP